MDRLRASGALVALLGASGAFAVVAPGTPPHAEGSTTAFSVPVATGVWSGTQITPIARAHAQGPPPGFTGGFGEESCRSCHTEFELGLGGELLVEGFPDRYEPGARYTVTLLLTSDGMTLAGFQAAIRGPSGAPLGTMAPVDASVVLHPDTAGLGTPYLQHAPGALEADTRASWSFEWTAPATPAGPAILHASANGANGDDSPLGDIVYLAEARSTPASR